LESTEGIVQVMKGNADILGEV